MTSTAIWQDHRGPALDSVGAFTVIDCEACGFKHVTPVPTEEELCEVYRHDYYTREKPLYLARSREDLDWWNLAYAERYAELERRLPPDRRRILDVGTGPGWFLLHGQERGWRTLGLEPSRAAAEHARGLGIEVVEEFLDDRVAAALGTFDAVHLSEVLEHLPDPARCLERCRGLLSPGGLISITVPNDYSPFQAVARDVHGHAPWWVAPPHHVNYFDFASLARLLRRTGFEVVAQDTTFPIDLFLLMGDDYVGNDALGRACHEKRMRFEQSLHAAGASELLRRLYRGLAELGIGRVVVTTAHKR
jgi:SAM-dependent methyltransferase